MANFLYVYLFGYVVLFVSGGHCALSYVDHVSEVGLKILDEVVQSGGDSVKAPNKQSSFLAIKGKT